MEWDLGPQGVALLAAMALGGGAVAALLVGGGLHRRWWSGAATALACLVVGLVISEGVFGWATEEELQPNIDGLSSDEALLSTFLTTLIVVVSMRITRRRRLRDHDRPSHQAEADLRHASDPRHPSDSEDLSDTAGRATPRRRSR